MKAKTLQIVYDTEWIKAGNEESDRDHLYFIGFNSFTEHLKMVKLNGTNFLNSVCISKRTSGMSSQ